MASTYTVKSGDGWYKIAKANNIDVNQLLKLNGANLNTMIHPGQVLKTQIEQPQPQKETKSVQTPRPVTTGGTGGYQTSFSSEFTNKVVSKIKNLLGFGGESKEAPKQQGQAFYITYPEHKISTSGTGFEFVGNTAPLIKGHAASIIIDDKGNATYHTYGRYNGDMGSYKTWNLPSMKKGEDQQAYLKRIRHKLEYSDSKEPVNATHIPSIDHNKARSYTRHNQKKIIIHFLMELLVLEKLVEELMLVQERILLNGMIG